VRVWAVVLTVALFADTKIQRVGDLFVVAYARTSPAFTAVANE
jgi:hypothetical protein